MKRLTVLALLLTFLLIGAGCTTPSSPRSGQGTPKPTFSNDEPDDLASQQFTVYQNSAYHFRMEYPADWTFSEMGASNIAVFFSDPSVAVKGFGDNVNVAAGTVESPVTLEEYTQAEIRRLEDRYADFSLLGTESTVINGVPAMMVTYTATTVSDNTKAQILHVFLLKGSAAYIVTYKSTPDRFNDGIVTVRQVIQSFEIT
ncbi:MAG: DcrB-related protein [Methanoregulaceae archaeon]|nr:DcrB-related protein [Methanoregulaceae archaeon]